MALQCRSQFSKLCLIAREQGKVWFAAGKGLTGGQRRNAPGNALCPVHKPYVWPERPGQLVLNQRKVGAGKHDRVDPISARLLAQRGRCPLVNRRVHRFAA